MSSAVCNHCGCSEIDNDPARGSAVCTGCGSVLEDQIIVSEVQFQENSIGGTSVIGQYVSAEGGKAHTMGRGFHHGFGKESRAITLQNGKKNLQMLGSQLKLNQHCIDTAFNFFKMAVSRRLTRGRKTKHVIAACLYLVCRTEGTPHMLLDFSDQLQVNVYVLGRTYLHLSRELCINCPAIDPCLLIQRFAHKLDFGNKNHEVAMTAMRIVSRMKRDWMATGRRPSGLCGAALFVAARIHDFNRTQREIIKVVKVCEATLRKRLVEFEETPSSELTIDEFEVQKIDLEEEQDPPSFKESRRKAKEMAQVEELGDEVVNEVSNLQKEIEDALEARMKKRYGKELALADSRLKASAMQNVTEEIITMDDEELSECASFVQEDSLNSALENSDLVEDSSNYVQNDTSSNSIHNISVLENETENSQDGEVMRLEQQELDSILMPPPVVEKKTCLTPGQKLASLRPTAASLGITEVVEECMKEDETEEANDCGGELDLEGIDDAELDKFILNPEEVRRKEAMWIRLNAVYIQEQKEKEERLQKEKESGVQKPEKKKRKKKPKNTAPAASAGEAIEKMLQEKKISSKINYEVLKDLNRAAAVETRRSEGPLLFAATPDVKPTTATLEKRFRRPSVSLDIKPDQDLDAPPLKQIKLGEPQEVVVESGPVEYAREEEEETDDFYEDEDEEHISAAQLMGHTGPDDQYDAYELDEDLD